MSHVVIIINHRPIPKQRVAWKNGRAYTPKKTRDYEKLVSDTARIAMMQNKLKPFDKDTPIKITFTFIFEIPKSWSEKKKQQALNGEIHPITTGIGDVDNLIKSCLDGFNEIVFADDKAVLEMSGKKKYGAKNQVIALVEEFHG